MKTKLQRLSCSRAALVSAANLNLHLSIAQSLELLSIKKVGHEEK